MDDTVNVWMCLEDLVEVFLLPDINIKETWSFAADELNPIDCLFRSVEEIVHDHNFVVCLK